LSEDDVTRVLGLLEKYGIEREAQGLVDDWHGRALGRLNAASESGPARDTLAALVNSLARRSG
jgi:hypothetical protein